MQQNMTGNPDRFSNLEKPGSNSYANQSALNISASSIRTGATSGNRQGTQGKKTQMHMNCYRVGIQCSLRSHMDGVRGLEFMHNCLVSASEDCTLKVWDSTIFSH